jgi:hypothetical protein
LVEEFRLEVVLGFRWVLGFRIEEELEFQLEVGLVFELALVFGLEWELVRRLEMGLALVFPLGVVLKEFLAKELLPHLIHH